MSGGNDGLNTLVPYADDAYYRLRPKIGIRAERLRKIDDRFGFNSGMVGFERLYKDGKLAVVHGCGYENPSFSHFTSMAYWHTAAPNRGDENGWVGAPPTPIAPQARPITLSISTRANRWRFEAGCIRLWFSMIPTSLPAKASIRSGSSLRRWPTRVKFRIPRDDFSSTSPEAQRARRRW
jgi:hypothetical protein